MDRKKAFVNVFEFICKIHGHPSCVVRIISHKFFVWRVFFYYPPLFHIIFFYSPKKGHRFRPRKAFIHVYAKPQKAKADWWGGGGWKKQNRRIKNSLDKRGSGKLQKRTTQPTIDDELHYRISRTIRNSHNLRGAAAVESSVSSFRFICLCSGKKQRKTGISPDV